MLEKVCVFLLLYFRNICKYKSVIKIRCSKRLKAIVMKSLFLFFSLLFFFACNPNKETAVDKDNPQYDTIDSSELYFRNMRKTFYDLEEMKQAGINLFRFSKRMKTNDKPILNICLVENWRTDRAYITLEPNELLAEENPIVIHWKDLKTQEEGTYQYKKGNKDEQYRFATELYTSIQKEHQLTVDIKGKETPFLDSQEEKEAFRITMFDFYRLVTIF